jgi:hypothetical protein
MKKPVCIFLICLVSGIVSAQQRGGRVNSTLDNSSIRRSEKAENKQLKTFQTHRRYSSVVNNPAAKAAKKKDAKAQKQGKGL